MRCNGKHDFISIFGGIEMGTLVYGAMLSHSPMMFVPGLRDAEAPRYRSALTHVKEQLHSREVDTLVVFYPDHFRQFRLDNMPTFSIGLDRISTLGDWYLPKREYPVDDRLALYLLQGLVDSGFDMAFKLNVMMDHGGAQPLEVFEWQGRRVVPIATNCTAPPLASLARCFELGQQVGNLLEDQDGGRVAVIGSGGLSHAVPITKWRDLDPNDERWAIYVTGVDPDRLDAVEAQRVQNVVDTIGTPKALIDEEFDQEFLSAMERGHVEYLTTMTANELQGRGGNGMNEVRAWMAAWGAMKGLPCQVVAYEPVADWVTGMGVVEIAPD